MKDSEKSHLLAEHTDQLLVMCSLKLRMTHGRHFEADDTAVVEEALQCYRALLATIISVSSSIFSLRFNTCTPSAVIVVC